MKRLTTGVMLVSILALAACGGFRDSRLNPTNWFGNARSAPVEVDPDAEVNPLIPTRQRGRLLGSPSDDGTYRGRPLDSVTALVIERVPGGAIVRASGTAARQGVYDVRLVTDEEQPVSEDGVLTFQLAGVTPDEAGTGISERVRTVTAAVALTDQQLGGVRVIRVVGVRNAMSSRRR